MQIIDKLSHQIESLFQEIAALKEENITLKNTIGYLNDQNDQLKYNNENMLLNIDKALHISSKHIRNLDDISHQS